MRMMMKIEFSSKNSEKMIQFNNFMVRIHFHRTSIHPIHLVDRLCRLPNSSSNHPQFHLRTRTYPPHIRNWLTPPNPTIFRLPLSIVRPAYLQAFPRNQRQEHVLVCLAMPLNVMYNQFSVCWCQNINRNRSVLTASDEWFDDKNRIIASFISLLIDFCSEPLSFGLLGETFESNNKNRGNPFQSICNRIHFFLFNKMALYIVLTGHDDMTSYSTSPFSSMPITLYPFEIILFFLIVLLSSLN